MKRAQIEDENRSMLRLQQDFRRAADVVTDALMTFEEVEAIAVIGSVAKSLWKEVPRFSEFRRPGSRCGTSARTSIWRYGFVTAQAWLRASRQGPSVA